MAITKFASLDILDVKGTSTKLHTASFDRVADFDKYRTDDGYLYVRLRAISSRVNKNHDSWPSAELAGNSSLLERHHSGGGFTVEASEGDNEYGFATFVGKPVFVDHHNSDPKKARGVIVDARLNVLSKEAARKDSYWGSAGVDALHMPASEIELLIEVDAKSFPRLAKAIANGDLDGFSMGCDVDYSVCSHCGHTAHSADEYCSHIVMKGAHHDYKTADGDRISKRSFEHCYGCRFFEISAVFDPADETAKAREVRAQVYKEADLVPGPGFQADVEPKPAPLAQDPARPHDMEVELLASQYEAKGVDPAIAMDMAQRQIYRDLGEPAGHGEGGSIENYAPHPLRYDPLPSGFPPPRRQGEPQTPFAQGAEDALNERYPQRPVMNDPHTGKTAENALPQEFMTRAPEEVDTLRDEQLCPICGNDMDSETCSVCGYVEPPQEFDNPDLGKAKEIRQQMKEQEESQAQPQAQPTQPGDQIGQPAPNAPGGGPLTSQMPTKAPATAHVTNDMRWTPKVHPKTAARINQVEHPITPSNPPVSNEPANQVVVKDQTKPVTAAMLTAQRLMADANRKHGESMKTRTADGPTPPGDTSPKLQTDVTGVGGVDEASNELASKADAQVDVTGVGTTGVSDVSADKTESLPTAGRDGDDSGFNTDKNVEAIHTETFGDKDGQHSGVGDPVTNEPFPASEDGVKASVRQSYDDGTLEQNEQQGNPVAQGGSAVKGVSPADPVGNAQDRVNVLEHTTSPSNNSGDTTTWSGTDGNGVLRQQDPITKDNQEWGGVSVPDVQLHTTGRVSLAALKLAEAELELGLISRDEKFNRIAELDTQDPRALQTQLETLAKVKTAGLNKLAQQRQSGVTRMPRAFGKNTAAPNGFERIATGAEQVTEQHITDDALDSALFTR